MKFKKQILKLSASLVLISLILSLLFFSHNSPANAASLFTITPSKTSQQITVLPEFPISTPPPETNLRPPLYDIPLALSPHDHFYFARPIPINSGKWSLADYRYGYIYPQKDVVHTGIDIVAPKLTTVLAAADGKVVFAGYGLLMGAGDVDDPYGKAVVIRHTFSFEDYTLYTVYAHLDTIYVKTGQWVNELDEIGRVGMTGMTSGPHLHFEIRIENSQGDKVQNPELWLVPPIGDGVLAGQIKTSFGSLMTTKSVWLTSLDTNKVWTIITYSSKTKQVDDFYQENFTLADLPEGFYEISTFYYGKLFKSIIKISPGAVNYIEFNGSAGFTQTFPSPPDPSQFIR